MMEIPKIIDAVQAAKMNHSLKIENVQIKAGALCYESLKLPSCTSGMMLVLHMRFILEKFPYISEPMSRLPMRLQAYLSEFLLSLLQRTMYRCCGWYAEKER